MVPNLTPLQKSKLRQTFKAPNEVGLFPFTNGVYGVYKRLQRRLVLANELQKKGLFVCKFVCDMLYVNLYVFGKTIGIPLGCQQRLGLAENHERGKQKYTDGEGSASPANSLSRLLEPKEIDQRHCVHVCRIRILSRSRACRARATAREFLTHHSPLSD